MLPAISVVICTLNRCALVRRAVQSVIDQDLSPQDFEIVVVDNGSTDGTRDVIAAMSAPSSLRVVHEPKTGLSNARNRGIREASAPLVAFLDDDAIAEPGWLKAHLGALRNDHDVVATGGPVRLMWPDGRPPWLPAEQESFYSGFDLGPWPRRMVFPEFPYGANMAIRRDLLDRVGGFSPQLGRRGGSLLSGEEREVFRRLSEFGGTFAYVPEAAVLHVVLPERARRSWFLRRAFAQGRSEVVLASTTAPTISRAGTAARAAARGGTGLVQVLAVSAAALGGKGPQEVMRRASRSAQSLGAAWEHARRTAAVVARSPIP